MHIWQEVEWVLGNFQFPPVRQKRKRGRINKAVIARSLVLLKLIHLSWKIICIRELYFPRPPFQPTESVGNSVIYVYFILIMAHFVCGLLDRLETWQTTALNWPPVPGKGAAPFRRTMAWRRSRGAEPCEPSGPTADPRRPSSTSWLLSACCCRGCCSRLASSRTDCCQKVSLINQKHRTSHTLNGRNQKRKALISMQQKRCRKRTPCCFICRCALPVPEFQP